LGEHVYAVVSDDLRIVDVSDPTRPVEVGLAEMSVRVSGLAVAEYAGRIYAYLGGEGVLYILDVSDPTTPAEVLSYGGVDRVNGLVVVGNVVYVAGGEGGLAILRFGDGE